MKRPSIINQIPFLTKFFFFIFLVLIAYAIIAHTILIPRAISTNYDQHLIPSFNKLASQYRALSKSTELPVYSDPYADLQSGRTDLKATQELIVETELTLQNYELQADVLPVSPLARFSDNYKKAKVTRERAKGILQQSREVISDYKVLNTYLLQVNTARIIHDNNTTDINAMHDLNVLAGQGDIIAKRSVQLGDAIKDMDAVKPPAAFSEYHATLTESFRDSQAGLDQLAGGLNAADDTTINAGAAVLQQAVKKYENQVATQYNTLVAESVVLAEAGRLADKANSLRPFMEQ